ncbi:MAG: hypothetical protein HYU99_07400 [Deltaproteobacteria bacterium]|nr:hypothetical protein [Deltaproteobacteria bacterium]
MRHLSGEKLIRVTAWVPRKNLALLLKKQKKKTNQSRVIRTLIDDEVERLRSWQAHAPLYGIAGEKDIDESLL